MKKLLFVTALLAMGTVAMGAAPIANGVKSDANVEVRAIIADESLAITDIDGGPIVLDFGTIQKADTQVRTATEPYKVRAVGAIDGDYNITMKLGEKDQAVDVALNAKEVANADLNAQLKLDKYAGVLKADKKEYIGTINGVITPTNYQKAEVGNYVGTTTIEVTVGDKVQ